MSDETTTITLNDAFSATMQRFQQGIAGTQNSLRSFVSELGASNLIPRIDLSLLMSYTATLDEAGGESTRFGQIAVQSFEEAGSAFESFSQQLSAGSASIGVSLGAVIAKSGQLGAVSSTMRGNTSALGSSFEVASGVSSKLAERQEALASSWSVVQERLQPGRDAVTSIGVAFSQAGSNVLEWITRIPGLGEGIGFISELGSSAFDLSYKTATTLGPFLALLRSMESLEGLAGGLQGSFSTLKGGFQNFVAPIVSIGKTIFSVIPTTIAWAVANWSALAPILAIIAAVAALIAIVVLVVKNWSVISEFFKNLWEKVKEIFQGFWEWITGFVSKIRDLIVGLVEKIAAPFKKIGEFFGKLFGRRGKNEGISLVDNVAEGIDSNNSIRESLANQYQSADRLNPHSDAKEGPFSRLSAVGRSIPQTIAGGIEKEQHTIKHALGSSYVLPSLSIQKRKPTQQGVSQLYGGRQTVNFNIDTLTVQASDFEDLMSFLRMLETKVGYRRQYA